MSHLLSLGRTPTLTSQETLEQLLQENARLRSELLKVRILAERDELTGLWNRSYFNRRLEEELKRLARHPSRSLSLIFADLNDLKVINDQHGHLAGDAAIAAVGNELQNAIRRYDVCCRWGGDEFAALLPDTTGESCTKLIKRLKRSIARVSTSHGSGLRVSFGAAAWPQDGTTSQELVRAADQAMYREKKSKPPMAVGFPLFAQ